MEEEKKNAPDYEQRTLDDFMNIEPLQQPAENTKEGQPVTVLQWNCCHLTSDKIQYLATKALNEHIDVILIEELLHVDCKRAPKPIPNFQRPKYLKPEGS